MLANFAHQNNQKRRASPSVLVRLRHRCATSPLAAGKSDAARSGSCPRYRSEGGPRGSHLPRGFGPRLRWTGLASAVFALIGGLAVFVAAQASLLWFPSQAQGLEGAFGVVASLLLFGLLLKVRLPSRPHLMLAAGEGAAEPTFEQDLASLAIDALSKAPEALPGCVGETLQWLGNRWRVQRAYQMLLDEEAGQLRRTREWTAAGVPPVSAGLRSMPAALLPAWLQWLRAGQTLRLNALDDLPENWTLERSVLQAQGVRAVMAVPLIDNGRLRGFIGLEMLDAARDWSDDDARRLRLVADVLAAADGRRRLDAARVASETRYREAIDDIQEVVFQADAQGRWTFLNPAWERITGCPAAKAIGRRALDFAHPEERHSALLQFKDLIRGQVGHCRHQLRCVTRDGDVRWLEAYVRLRRGPEGEVVGAFGTLMDITERKAAEEEIRQLAFFDPLTGLPNRRLLMDRLHQALSGSTRSRQHGAVLFIDLDNFKALNDTRGHHVGDLLLQQVAARLRGCVRQSDTVARLGGDEFVVMLTDLSAGAKQAAAQVATVGEKIRNALGMPYDLGGGLHHSTPSIGATVFFDHELSIEELLKRADVAMYQAKAAGRNALCFFEPPLQALHASRMRQARDLHSAFGLGQLNLLYQPQLDEHGRVTAAEALVRWRHPGRGTITAAELVPRAIEDGLILQLGQWVMEQACARLAAWAADPELAALSLAVNVSVQQLQAPRFVPDLLAILQATGADPRRLRLEMTERLFVEDLDALVTKLYALKGHGIGLALDDFGIGHGTLLGLRRLPVDQLKIDQSFVQGITGDPSNAAVARTIIAIGQTLGLAVVAEGVERHGQRRRLLDAGCRGFQGYLFSRPVPWQAFKARTGALNRAASQGHGD